jgi:hypothetical protein
MDIPIKLKDLGEFKAIKIKDGEFKDKIKEVYEQDSKYFYTREYKLEKNGYVPYIHQIERIHCDVLKWAN